MNQAQERIPVKGVRPPSETARRLHNLEVALRFARAGIAVHPSKNKRSICPLFQMLDTQITLDERKAAIDRFATKNEGRSPVHVGCTVDETVIKKISRLNPRLEWSISTGPAGWFVIDADFDRAGPENIRRLFEEKGGIPANCFVVNTQSSGLHIVFKNHLGLGAHTGELGAMGCDIRAKNNQVVCPGTQMASGKRYSVDKNFSSFEAAFGNGNSLPEIPAFIASLVGTAVHKSPSDHSLEVKLLIQQLEENDWPSFDDAFDEILGHDLAQIAYRRPGFSELFNNATGDHSKDRFNLARHLVLGSNGVTILDYAALCKECDGAGEFDAASGSGKGYYSNRDLAKEFASALHALSEWGPPNDGNAFGAVEGEEGPTRVPVDVNMNDPGMMVRRVEGILIKNAAQIYRRGNSIVEVVTDKPLPGVEATTPTAQLLAVNVERLAQLAGSHIDFRKFSQRAEGFVSCPPPRDLMMHVMARGVRSKFPRINVVAATPMIRPDGSVLSKAGYDPATEIYLIGGLDLPLIPDFPTREDGLAALALVGELFSECAFADKDANYPLSSVGISAVMSIAVSGMARLLMSGIPMLTCTAATPGSGKSFIGKIIGILLTGREVAVSSVAVGFTAELDKRLTAGLLGGASIVHLDNCNGKLDSDLLCQILTEGSVAVRPLGASEEVIISGMPMVLANGNGVQVDENLARRTLLVELDARMEKPELRNFNLRPDRLLVENRGAYVAAILTALRAYLLAVQRGDAKPIKPKVGSFEGWSDFARSLMIWYGYRDPADATAAAQSEDPEKSARGAIFRGLRQLFKDTPFTVGDVIGQLENIKYDVLDELGLEGSASRAEICQAVEENLRSLLPKLQNRPLTAQGIGILFRGWVTKVEVGLTLRRRDRNVANVMVYSIIPSRPS